MQSTSKVFTKIRSTHTFWSTAALNRVWRTSWHRPPFLLIKTNVNQKTHGVIYKNDNNQITKKEEKNVVQHRQQQQQETLTNISLRFGVCSKGAPHRRRRLAQPPSTWLPQAVSCCCAVGGWQRRPHRVARSGLHWVCHVSQDADGVQCRRVGRPLLPFFFPRFAAFFSLAAGHVSLNLRPLRRCFLRGPLAALSSGRHFTVFSAFFLFFWNHFRRKLFRLTTSDYGARVCVCVCVHLCYHVSMNCTDWPNMPCGFDVESLVDFETALTSTSAAFQSGGHCDDWTAISDFDSEALALIKDTQLDSSEFHSPFLCLFFSFFFHRISTRPISARQQGHVTLDPPIQPSTFTRCFFQTFFYFFFGFRQIKMCHRCLHHVTSLIDSRLFFYLNFNSTQNGQLFFIFFIFFFCVKRMESRNNFPVKWEVPVVLFGREMSCPTFTPVPHGRLQFYFFVSSFFFLTTKFKFFLKKFNRHLICI